MMRRLGLLAAALAAVTGAAMAQDGLTLAEAIRLALAKNPAIQLQQGQSRAAAGAALQARAPFDTVLSAGLGAQRDQRPLRADEQTRYPAAGTEQTVQGENLRLGMDRQLAAGPQIGAAYTYNAALDTLQTAQNIPLQAGDRLSFSMRLPLQRNLGREAAAGLNAAQAEAQAAQLEAEHTVAATVLSVAQGYWDWTARLASLQAARQAEERLARLVRETEKLVQADELPPAELNLVRASLVERGAARTAAEQRQLEARHALGRLLGLTVEQARQLPAPAHRLPERAAPLPDLAPLRLQALAGRRDLQAARAREEAGQSRLEAAQSALRPQTDFVISGYYAGLRENDRIGNGLPLAARHSGPGVAASLVFQLPVGRSAASGALEVAAANLDNARLRRNTLEDGIAAALEQIHAALLTAAAQLDNSDQVVERYRISVRNEETKRLLGSATLIDVLNIEDRLNNALLARLQYQQAYVSTLAQLQFEAGRLLQAGEAGTGYSVDLPALLPAAATPLR